MADYLVIKGKDRATIEIAQETKVVFPFTFNVVAVKVTSGSVTVSLSAGAQSGDDGSDTIAEGDSTVFSQLTAKEIYISGSGTVKVWAGVRPEFCPFSKGAKGGGGSGGGCNYKGTTTTAIENGSTANPITIDGESYTAVFGDIVVYGYTEFVFDGTQWSEFGRPFDTIPTENSANAVTSGGIYAVTPWIRQSTGTGAYMGASATASGATSVAVGYHSTSRGKSSLALGYYAETGSSAHYSASIGNSTQTTNADMLAIGKYNLSREGDLFNIGVGLDGSHRSNILEVNRTEMNVNGDIKKNNVSLPTPYTTMPTITAAMVGQIAMYVGETTNDYVKGYFYIASSDGAAEPTYSWVSMVDSTPTSGSKNLISSEGINELIRKGTSGRGVLIGSGAGLWTYTNSNLTVVGKYNTATSGNLFEIGAGGGSSSRKNILEANSTSVNVNGDIQRDGIGIDDYTTTERKIGKWIDGSDLYQRTFEVTGIHNDGTYDDNILGTSDIVIRDWTGYIQYDTGTDKLHYPIHGICFSATDWIGCWVTTGLADLAMHAKINTETYTLDKAVITIKYTKPSVEANLLQTAPTEEVSETPTVEEDDMR